MNTIIILLLIICIILSLYNSITITYYTLINFYNKKIKYAYDEEEYTYPFILNNVLTKDQIKNIKIYCEDKLVDSMVVSGKINSIRNSKQTWISKYDSSVKPVFENLSKFFNIPYENAEDLQIVKYLPNQYYKDHHDACCDDVKECHEFIKKGGQRILTVLIYLNDDFEGGETNFKNLNIKIKAKSGDAIVFYPLRRNGKYCHPKALHAGLPVTRGEKWIANVWFREKVFS